MNKKAIAWAFAFMLMFTLFTLWVVTNSHAGGENIVWAEIHNTDLKKNKNFWRAELEFNITLETVDAFAFNFTTNETPPSMDGKIWLIDGNGTILIHKEPVYITNDTLNGTWHVEYLNETVEVITGHNYTFRFWIKANNILIPEDETFMVIGDFNFRLGHMAITNSYTPPPANAGGGSLSTRPSDIDPPATAVNETTGGGWFDGCNIGIILPSLIVICGIVAIRGKKT